MIRELMNGLWNVKKMTTHYDHNEVFLRAEQPRSDLSAHEETVSDQQFKEVITNGISDEYRDVAFTIRRDTKSGAYQIHLTMSAIYQKDISGNGEHKMSSAVPF